MLSNSLRNRLLEIKGVLVQYEDVYDIIAWENYRHVIHCIDYLILEKYEDEISPEELIDDINVFLGYNRWLCLEKIERVKL